jgi:hypothetical protein
MSTEEDLKRDPEGILVQSKNGQFFFIPNNDLKRLAVPKEISETARKIWSEAGPPNQVAHPNDYCRVLLEYLLSHDPQEETWRRISVEWMNKC